MIIYTVKSGDTLYEIAKTYRSSEKLLAEVNGLDDPSYLSVGQALIIPFPKTVHTVSSGETLSTISRVYGVTRRNLWQNNPHLYGDDDLTVGDELVIEYDETPTKTLSVNSFAYPCIDQKIFRQALPYLSTLTPFSYGFTSEGDLVGLPDDTVIETTKEYGVPSVLLLSTLNTDGKFDNSLSHALLSDETAQEYLLSNLVSLMLLKGFSSLVIDFEFMFSEDRLPFVDFLKRAKRALTPYRFKLGAALAPKTRRDHNGLMFDAHDYRLIGDVCDFVQLMTYEWGYCYELPYALSPYHEIKRVIEYAISEIPHQKIVLGIPNYAYDLTLSNIGTALETKLISFSDALLLAREKKAEIQFDERAKMPYFRYFDHKTEHRVWFEDARSYQALLSLVLEYDLDGVSIWNAMSKMPQGYFMLTEYKIR